MTNLLRWPVLLGLSCVLVLATACGGGGPGGPNSSDPDVGVYLIVQKSLPTNGQEVQGDLIDAGEEQDAGKITLLFSERVDPSTILDPSNSFNGLTSEVNVLNAAFQRVPGTPRITGPRGNVFEFIPSVDLPNQQYTVTVSRDVMSFDGSRLNGGQFDYHTSFTVKTDSYGPVIRNTYPAASQTDVPKTAQVIVTFNESLNPTTVNTGTLTVVDGGQNPPVAIPGTVGLSADGFSAIFTPDPANPFPPNSTIVVTVVGGTSGMKDIVGNVFDGDPGASFDYVFSFQTVKEPPLPNAPRPFYIGGPLGPPQAAVFYGTYNGHFGVIEEIAYINNTNDLTLWGTNNPVLHSDTQLHVDNHAGRIHEIVVDPRLNPVDAHGWAYVTDPENRAVHVVASRTCRIVHSWTALRDPRGLAIDAAGISLLVTNVADDTVSFLDISVVSPVGTTGAPDRLKVIDQVGGQFPRFDLPVGRGPLGIACGVGLPVVFTANSLDDTCTVFDFTQRKTLTTFPIGARPYDVAATFNYTGIGYFAFISCQGVSGDDGSIALYWSSPNGLQANITGFDTPLGIAFDYNISCWVANSGSNRADKLTLQVVGGGFYPTIIPSVSSSVTVGNNPVDVCVDPFFTVLTGVPSAIITADRGSSQVSFIDSVAPARAIFSLPLPGVTTVAGIMDQ